MLRNLGQSIWPDNISDLIDSGTLKSYNDDLWVTGSTSNPTIFDYAITHSKSYDSEIRRLVGTDSWQDLLKAIETKSKALK